MKNKNQRKPIATRGSSRFLLWAMIATAGLIVLTRVLTLTHNRQLHPDEHVFYLNTYSLLRSILEPGTPFVENKEYPEGAYCFQLIFQFAGEMLRRLLGIEGTKGLQHFGRLASVTYFTLASTLGLRLVWRYLAKNKAAVVTYGLSMTFSLLFIEQSRYGTGDMISLMLLMLLLNLTAQAVESAGKKRWWAASFLVSGMLGAVKYPQLVFVLIPLGAFLSRREAGTWKKLLLFLAALVGGFLLVSPKTLLDPAYVLRVIQRETFAYANSSHESGGIFNHLVNMAVYLLLYSDFPLLPLGALGAMAWGIPRFFRTRAGAERREGTALLFEVIVPGVCLFFLAYNLVVPVMFFRTFLPFFGILMLYTATAAGRLFAGSRWSRLAVVILAGCMVLRGGAFLWALSDDSKAQEKLSAMLSEALDENWKETWHTCFFSFQLPETEGITVHPEHFVQPLITANEGPEIQPGQLVITGAQEYYLGQDYLLPIQERYSRSIRAWESFKEANQDYLLGQVYPDWYYYLFGGWLRGGTLSQYEFPCHYIYYRSR